MWAKLSLKTTMVVNLSGRQMVVMVVKLKKGLTALLKFELKKSTIYDHEGQIIFENDHGHQMVIPDPLHLYIIIYKFIFNYLV